MSELMIEEGDGWLLNVHAWQITRCMIDYGVTLEAADGDHWIRFRLGSDFVFTSSDERLLIDLGSNSPTAVCPVLKVLHKNIGEAKAFKDGTLRIEFADGAVITAAPDDRFEAWEISSEHQEITIVSLPGGGLVTWKSPNSATTQ